MLILCGFNTMYSPFYKQAILFIVDIQISILAALSEATQLFV